MKPYEYFRPTTLKEALDFLKQHRGEAEILNGGTDLIVRMREGHSEPKFVVDVKGIKELHEITVKGDEVSIGACVSMNAIAASPEVLAKAPFLAKAANSVGSKQVRNRATCIGNICNASPLADTATPVLALDTTVHIYGEDGVKTVPITDFFVFVRKTILSETDIVTHISFKAPKNGQGLFSKIARRKEVDLSTVCGTVIKDDDGYRIAMGSVAPTPLRLKDTETYLNGAGKITQEVIEKAADMASKEVSPIDDVRATKEYRRQMVAVIMKRTLSEWMS